MRVERTREQDTAGGSPTGDAAPRWRVSDLFLFALGAGLLIGLGEVAGVAWRYYVKDAVTHITPHVVWMAPVGYAVLFLVAGLALLGVSPVRASLRGPAAAVFVFGTLGFAGWLEMTPWGLHPVAIWVLAGGASSQLGRLAARRPHGLVRWTRRAVPVLSVLTVALGAVVVGRERLVERRALSALPESPAGAANVLLLVLDTVRAKSLSLYGYGRATTPGLDALAAEATVFDAAFATSPWTLPSHASMFTGRWPHEVSTGWSTPLDDSEPTLAEVLSRRGYVTAGFVANLAYGARPYGLARGFAHYEDFPINVGQVILATSLGRTLSTTAWIRDLAGEHELLNRKTAGRIRRDFVRWLDRRPDGPFFAFLNFFDAHEPYEPPPPYDEAFGRHGERRGMGHRQNLLRGVNARRLDKWAMPAEEIPGELAAYEGAIAYLDAELSRLFDDLSGRGLLDQTLLIVTSDHGELFGEHGMFDHGQNLYLPAVHVPLVIRYPGPVPAGARVPNPVSIRDLPATILDLIGLAGEVSFPGVTLRHAWEADSRQAEARVTETAGGGTPEGGPSNPWAGRAGVLTSPAHAGLHRGLVEQPWYPIARGLEMQSLVDAGFHYICNPDATEELYDLANDPEELRNLVESPRAAPVVEAFRAAAAHLDAPPRGCPPAPGAPLRAPRQGRR